MWSAGKYRRKRQGAIAKIYVRSLSYLILTARELIEVDIKKSREKRYDIYKISHMKPALLGLCFTFRYSGSIFGKKCWYTGNSGVKIY